jgi:hypothetical protein
MPADESLRYRSKCGLPSACGGGSSACIRLPSGTGWMVLEFVPESAEIQSAMRSTRDRVIGFVADSSDQLKVYSVGAATPFATTRRH